MTAPAAPTAPAVTHLAPALDAGAASGAPESHPGWRSRLRRARWPLAVVTILLLGSLVYILVAPTTSSVPYAPDNPGRDGAMALAEVLRREGVDVEHARTRDDMARLAGPGTTVLVMDDVHLTEQARSSLLSSGADLVLADPQSTFVALASGGQIVRHAQAPSSDVATAACTDPDATAAWAITTVGRGFTGGDDATLCFPTDVLTTAGGPTYGLATIERHGGARLTALASRELLTNAHIIDEGNAALALRLLGRNDTLVWYQATYEDTGVAPAEAGATLLDLVPGPSAHLLWLAGAVLLMAIVWRGRRLGPVVGEPLPVIVRSGEATLGRARLYRRGHAHGHAAAALRAGTADRLARRTGLPRSASGTQVVDAICRATGRHAADVSALLYGPPPADDAALVRLTQMLDQLESEVDRT